MFVFGWKLDIEKFVAFLNEHQVQMISVIEQQNGEFPYPSDQTLTTQQWISVIQDNVAITLQVHGLWFDLISVEKRNQMVYYFGVEDQKMHPEMCLSFMTLFSCSKYNSLRTLAAKYGAMTEHPVLITF